MVKSEKVIKEITRELDVVVALEYLMRAKELQSSYKEAKVRQIN